LEDKFNDISHNIPLLIVDLVSKLRSFREVGSSNSDIGSEGKLGDNEDLEKDSR
jgi:hypothetical protein